MPDIEIEITSKDDSHFKHQAWRKKLHLRLDEDLHKKIKMKCAEEGISIQQFILDLVQKAI